MKRIFLTVIVLVTLVSIPLTFTAAAQTTAIDCGSTVTGEFTKIGDSKSYTIIMGVGERLTIIGQPEKEGQRISILLAGPQDTMLEGANSSGTDIEVKDVFADQSPVINSNRLSTAGTYAIIVSNNRIYATAEDGIVVGREEGSYNGGLGTFVLQIRCLGADGVEREAGTPPPQQPTEVALVSSVISARSQVGLECGSIHSSAFSRPQETHLYSLDMASTDTSFTVGIEPQGDYLKTIIGVQNPRDEELDFPNVGLLPSPSVVAQISDGGSYEIRVTNMERWHYGGVGAYSIFITCVTAEGVIQPGDAVDTAVVVAPSVAPIAPSCPNSPAPRLEVGEKGLVTPGDDNNLRDSPNGSRVGEMKAGTEFDVLEGPVCGRGNLSFWRVQAGELTGWTAEGQGSEYWLEPIQRGRG